MTSDQPDGITWRDGTIPVSRQFDDPYYSLENGLEETRHVFLAGNDLPARLCDGFHVAELGFGTGLNLLALLDIWSGDGQIRYTGFEAFPITREEAERALAPFLPALADPLVAQWNQTGFVWETSRIRAEMIVGDARQRLPQWSGMADAWFLDGFSPAKNPELWEPDLLRAVAEHTNAGGTFATYSAAGAVRRALTEAGFQVTRTEGFGRKRHMSKGVK